MFFRLFVSGKQIGSQGFFPFQHKTEGFFDVIKGYHRQDGAENFFLHNGVLPGDMIHDGRFNPQGRRIRGAPIDHFLRSHQVYQTLEMFLVYDFSVVRIVQRMGTVHFGDHPG